LFPRNEGRPPVPKRWPEIAEQMYYTESNVYKMHGKALQKVEEILAEQGRPAV